MSDMIYRLLKKTSREKNLKKYLILNISKKQNDAGKTEVMNKKNRCTY